jgi:hypothetical protein
MRTSPIYLAVASVSLIRRPVRDLLRQLPALPVTESGEPDYADADPDLLERLAESAELVLQIVHGGFSAIGLLQSHTSQQIEDGEIKVSHAIAVGRRLVELGEVLAYAQALSVECRRHTSDHAGSSQQQ